MRCRLHIACCLAALAAGCAPLGLDLDEAAPAQDAMPDRAETLLIEAAQRAEAALTVLARIRSEESPQMAAPVPRDAPPELRRTATLDWIGPVETLAEALAKRAGYGFVAVGPRPVRPVIVAVAARDRPLIDLLRDAGIRLGEAGTLTVDAGRQTVRLDWRAAPSVPLPVERPGTAGP